MSIDDLDTDISNTEFRQLDPETVKDQIPKYTSQKLCEMIVCDRYFGCYRDISIMCMQELAQRRQRGDDFEFEKYIDQAYKELPELSFNIPNIRNILSQTKIQK